MPIHVFAKWKVRPGELENVLLILKELKVLRLDRSLSTNQTYQIKEL
jgi:hypothetical protein